MDKSLLIGIPALNEAASIGAVIAALPRSLPGVRRVAVVVVDDGSTDDTGAIARAQGASVIRHRRTLGLGRAFQSILRHAVESGADVLVTLDADGQFDPADIPALVESVLVGHADVCTASRFADPTLVPAMPAVKRWGNDRVAALVSQLSGREFRDVSCGFRAYSRDALLRLTVHGTFTYTHETLLDLTAKGLTIGEVPLRVRGERQHGQSRIASSVLRYALHTSSIMVRFYRDHEPIGVCVALAIPPAATALGLIAVSLREVMLTGYWLKWAAFSGGALLAVSAALVFFGFMADIASGLRRNQEEILYWLRRRASDEAAAALDADRSPPSDRPA
jgi:glycosyltransferase involved in cell wall biosynthesis